MKTFIEDGFFINGILKNNHHSNTYLQNAWNKYGRKSFRIYPIESFELSQKDSITKEKLDELEEYYIKKFDTFENGFNLTTGGEKCKMSPLSEEAKRKIGEKNKINMLGKKLSDETKKKMSESHKGDKNPMRSRMWIRNPQTKEFKVWLKTEPLPEGWERGKYQPRKI